MQLVYNAAATDDYDRLCTCVPVAHVAQPEKWAVVRSMNEKEISRMRVKERSFAEEFPSSL